jgi:hypothetical protein
MIIQHLRPMSQSHCSQGPGNVIERRPESLQYLPIDNGRTRNIVGGKAAQAFVAVAVNMEKTNGTIHRNTGDPGFFQDVVLLDSIHEMHRILTHNVINQQDT